MLKKTSYTLLLLSPIMGLAMEPNNFPPGEQKKQKDSVQKLAKITRVAVTNQILSGELGAESLQQLPHELAQKILFSPHNSRYLPERICQKSLLHRAKTIEGCIHSIQAGIDINERRRSGKTRLQKAIKHSDNKSEHDIALWLIKQPSCNPYMYEVNGNALEAALYYERHDILSALWNRMASDLQEGSPLFPQARSALEKIYYEFIKPSPRNMGILLGNPLAHPAFRKLCLTHLGVTELDSGKNQNPGSLQDMHKNLQVYTSNIKQAIKTDDLTYLQQFAEEHRDIWLPKPIKVSWLCYAARHGSLETVNALLKMVRTLEGPALVRLGDRFNEPLNLCSKLNPRVCESNYLIDAIKRRSPQILRLFLEDGPRIDVKHSPYNYQPLHYAAKQYGCLSYRLLLERGANPLASSTTGITPLEKALVAGRSQEVLNEFMQHGQDKQFSNSVAFNQTLAMALKTGNTTVAEWVIQKKNDFKLLPELFTRELFEQNREFCLQHKDHFAHDPHFKEMCLEN